MKKLNLLPSDSTKENYQEKVSQACDALFDHKRSASKTSEKVRRDRLFSLLSNFDLVDKKIADIGCGGGSVSLHLARQGAHVTAVDASQAILATFDDPLITKKKAALPYLPLNDSSFDGIVLTDVVAEIEPHLHRLALSEASRLLKKEGWMLVSTPLDPKTFDADRFFLELLETEFEILEIKKSYFLWGEWIERSLPAPFSFPASGFEWVERWTKRFCYCSGLTHMIVLARKKKMVYNG